MENPQLGPIRAVVREARELGQHVRNGDSLQWAIVRRMRVLLGLDLLEERTQQLSLPFSNELQQDLVPETPSVSLPTAKPTQAELDFQIRLFTEWVSSAPLPRTPLISVILVTTGERENFLRQAINSVFNQRYVHFELIIVCPPSTDLGDHASDSRLRIVHSIGHTSNAGRNLGLATVKGEFVVYADDDNTMGPDWLRAVVWAFTDDSSIDVVYGARLHEQINHYPNPALWHFEPVWDPIFLQSFCPIDTNVLGHRSGLDEARWDETLLDCQDWEIAIRLTARGRVRPLAVRASTYTTSAPGRVTDTFATEDTRTKVLRKAKHHRTLRVLAFAHSMPRISEAYIESELAALDARFKVALGSERPGQAGVASAFTHLGDFDQACDQFQPDVVLFFYSDVAIRNRDRCEALGIPYGVRVHSYDEELTAHAFSDDRMCVGVWAYPTALNRWCAAGIYPNQQIVHELPSLFAGLSEVPFPPGPRSGVAYVSAGLPKRNWDDLRRFLIGANDLERHIFLGTCDGHTTGEIDLLLESFRHVDPRVDARRDVPNAEVLRLLTVTSVLLYLPSTTHLVANPRSIVEAWLCGAIPLLPDTPDSRLFAQDRARYYSSLSHAVEIARTVIQSGGACAAERLANRDYAAEVHASVGVFDKFSNEFRSAVGSWELTNHAG